MSKYTDTFWALSNMQGAGSARGEARRWSVRLASQGRYISLLNRVEGALEPTRFLGDANRALDIEDFPWVHPPAFVVSDRVREILECLSPGDGQYFPIDIRFEGRSIGVSYWVLHVPHVLDCVNEAASSRSPSYDGRKLFHRITIDPTCVPLPVALFRARYFYNRPIVRDNVRRAFRKQKITGHFFYPP